MVSSVYGFDLYIYIYIYIYIYMYIYIEIQTYRYMMFGIVWLWNASYISYESSRLKVA